MKDLYGRLGSCGPKDPAPVERALREQDCDRQDLLDAAFVFGDAARKQQYDDCWRTLLLVAMIRHRFRMTQTPLWCTQTAGDFATVPWSAERAAQCLPFDAEAARVNGGSAGPASSPTLPRP
jgi:hypothetical protein